MSARTAERAALNACLHAYPLMTAVKGNYAVITRASWLNALLTVTAGKMQNVKVMAAALNAFQTMLTAEQAMISALKIVTLTRIMTALVFARRLNKYAGQLAALKARRAVKGSAG